MPGINSQKCKPINEGCQKNNGFVFMSLMRKFDHILSLVFLLFFAPFLCSSSIAATLGATAAVEKTDVFKGESFIFQIQVSGSENPERPDFSSVTDFIVAFSGGQQNSSRSVSFINGKIRKSVKEGYFFSYRLTPKRTGRLVIPPVLIYADGHSTQTEMVVINVREPVETDDFKLRLKLSKEHCYVGEPIILTVTWYIGKDVNEFNFTLPLLEDDSFHFIDDKVDLQSGKKLYRIPLRDGEVIGEKGQGRIGNKDYATITFKKILIPKRAGNVLIEPAAVACNALVGYERRRSRQHNDFFSDFFNDDFFGRSQRGRYRKVVVPSNSLTLQVSDLPEKGRPGNFSGLVGEYRIKVSAVPTEVNVGDPITLTITLSGPDYLEYVKLPTLDQQPKFAGNFKIPKERATGEILGKTKVFAQTIRALRQDVKEIPAIELPYFDTRTGTYRVARTKPVPLKVKKTKIITVMDAEGIAPQVSGASEIQTWSKGIAFNFVDMSVLENQRLGPVSWFRTPLQASVILLPPVVFFLLLTCVSIMRRRNADPLKVRSRKAFSILTVSLKNAQKAPSAGKFCDNILDAFRSYLGDKLGMPSGAMTFNDVKDVLESKGFDQATLEQLKEIFEKCEAGRYAGTESISDTAFIMDQGVQLAKVFEKTLK